MFGMLKLCSYLALIVERHLGSKAFRATLSVLPRRRNMVQRVKGKLQMAQHLNPTRMQSKNPMLISMLGYLNAHHGFVVSAIPRLPVSRLFFSMLMERSTGERPGLFKLPSNNLNRQKNLLLIQMLLLRLH